ncbi:MAG: hypothetical protein CVV64_19150 [Candidatus Wallbacteria bacterium HGW-Wallbacteria-1]|jgi:hypothetical protein|uniref:Uncharacterized protein n=1 Tax=Candidatus Wallbacteria bacterium HGW-Wallbacteria-1 TaxID=2013854 RepID=A0A2N1PJ56_9BACT|nr:MAG: hypothetical protein CVV64_19150 [Candidatus Wallbacteria bacterium HGW-Wallbacteria-1]
MKPNIDRALLNLAMDSHGEQNWFLDRETGVIFEIPINSDLQNDLKVQELCDKVDADPARFIEIESISSRSSFKMMEDFIETLPDKKERRALEKVITWKKPFANFRKALDELPKIQKLWSDFYSARMAELSNKWLEFHNLI